MIVVRGTVHEVRSARRLLQVFDVSVNGGRHVGHAVDQRAGGDLGRLLGEPVADLNEPGGRCLDRTYRLVSRLVVHVRRRVSGIVQRVGGRMVPYVLQLDLLADVLGLGRLSDGSPTCG